MQPKSLDFSYRDSPGHGGKVEGLGTFAPSIDLEGKLAISFHPDPAFANGLNVPGVTHTNHRYFELHTRVYEIARSSSC